MKLPLTIKKPDTIHELQAKLNFAREHYPDFFNAEAKITDVTLLMEDDEINSHFLQKCKSSLEKLILNSEENKILRLLATTFSLPIEEKDLSSYCEAKKIKNKYFSFFRAKLLILEIATFCAPYDFLPALLKMSPIYFQSPEACSIFYSAKIHYPHIKGIENLKNTAKQIKTFVTELSRSFKLNGNDKSSPTPYLEVVPIIKKIEAFILEKRKTKINKIQKNDAEEFLKSFFINDLYSEKTPLWKIAGTQSDNECVSNISDAADTLLAREDRQNTRERALETFNNAGVRVPFLPYKTITHEHYKNLYKKYATLSRKYPDIFNCSFLINKMHSLRTLYEYPTEFKLNFPKNDLIILKDPFIDLDSFNYSDEAVSKR